MRYKRKNSVLKFFWTTLKIAKDILEKFLSLKPNAPLYSSKAEARKRGDIIRGSMTSEYILFKSITLPSPDNHIRTDSRGADTLGNLLISY